MPVCFQPVPNAGKSSDDQRSAQKRWVLFGGSSFEGAVMRLSAKRAHWPHQSGSVPSLKTRATTSGGPMFKARRIVGLTPALPNCHCSILCSKASGSEAFIGGKVQVSKLIHDQRPHVHEDVPLMSPPPESTTSVSRMSEWSKRQVLVPIMV